MMGEILSENHLWLLLLMQGTACIALGLAGSFLLKCHASRAHQILLIALLASVLMPASYVCVKHFGLGVLVAEVPVAPEASLDLQPVDAIAMIKTPEMEVESAEVIAEVEEPASLPSVDRARRLPVPWRAILLVGWAVTTAALLARLAFRFALSAYLLRNAQPVDAAHMRQALNEGKRRLGIAGPVEIRASDKVRSPVIWCWSRTATLLVQTDAIEGLCRRDWVGVFCHELAHLKRLDHLAGLFAELLICLAPWHPLLWWARKQLLRFSEEACDDWVLAGGQIGVDYAESLLELAPQRQLAFVPTVVGKEKTMKTRIRRIVQERCGNPHIGRRWATLVTLVVLGLAVGVAFAQRRPAEPPEIQYQEQRELMIAGRRNVLNRLLEQLVDQTHEIEAALRERGDDPGADGYVMRAELDALREHIGIVERQLRNLEQRDGARPDEVRDEELARQRERLAGRARRVELELEKLGEERPEARKELELELRRLHEQLKIIRTQEQTERERVKEEEEIERMRIRETRERPRREDEPMRELSRHLRELQTQARETEFNLQRVDDKDDAEARELRVNLDKTHEEMIRVEEELQRVREERTASARARGGRADRRRVEGEPVPDELLERQNAVRDHLRELELKLRELTENGQGNSDAARGARQDLRKLEEEMRLLQRQARNRRRDAMMPQQEMPYGMPLDERPGNPDMERQVEELRGKVDGMHEEMAQMRQMLQQLLERSQVKKEEVQEFNVY